MIKMESPYAFAFLAQQPTDFLVILLNVRVAALRVLLWIVLYSVWKVKDEQT